MLKRRLISSMSAPVAAIVLSSLLAFGQGQPPQSPSPKSKATAKRKPAKRQTTPRSQPTQPAPQLLPPPEQPQAAPPQAAQPQAPQPPDQQAQTTPPADVTPTTPVTAVAPAVPASAKRPGVIRLGLVAPITPLKQGGPGNEFSEAIRQSLAAYLNSPVSETVPLEARVPVLAELEARQKECDFIFYSTVTERQRSNDLAKFMAVAAPVADLASSQRSASNKAAPVKPSATATGEPAAATTAAPTATETAPPATLGTPAPATKEKSAPVTAENALKAVTDLSNKVTAGAEVVFEFKLVEPGAEKPKLAKALKAKVQKEGDDALSALLAQAANDVLQATIKK
jgi:hypothetical protein